MAGCSRNIYDDPEWESERGKLDLKGDQITILQKVRPAPFVQSQEASEIDTKADTNREELAEAPCDACRQKHRTCDRRSPTCGSCAKRGVGCIYSPRRRKTPKTRQLYLPKPTPSHAKSRLLKPDPASSLEFDITPASEPIRPNTTQAQETKAVSTARESHNQAVSTAKAKDKSKLPTGLIQTNSNNQLTLHDTTTHTTTTQTSAKAVYTPKSKRRAADQLPLDMFFNKRRKQDPLAA